MTKATESIEIKNARLHNLKHIDLSIPRNTFTVVTGVSGSGKSTLAFDTLYAEGQRRYVESLSSYARQFLGKINKPEVDYIRGIPPAIAIEQKVSTRNPRSTVGTSTEIYDYMKLLFARAGITYSPVTGQEVKRHTVTDVIDSINDFEEGTKMYLLIPMHLNNGKTLKEALNALNQEGFSRVEYKGEIQRIEDLLTQKAKIQCEELFLLIDRFKAKHDEEAQARYADSIQQAFAEGKGECFLVLPDTGERLHFSNRFEVDGMQFEEPSEHMFSFNNPIGACPTCEGYGKIIGIDEELVIPNKKLSVYEDAIACWRGEKMQEWKEKLIYSADKFDFPIHKPYDQLTDKQRNLLWEGNKYFKGLNAFFAHLEKKKYKIQHRVMLARYRGKTTCPDCRGTRLKKEASYVQVAGKSMQDLVLMPITELQDFFRGLSLTTHQQKVADRILKEIRNRLKFLLDVGLGYLTLNRLSNTLSGGESQRINLATSLGSSLVGSLYILDEPSIGLHPRDTERLIEVLKQLRDLGNTVVVVEHDEDIIRAADHIVDIGPLAGRHGGEIVYQGGHEALLEQTESLTAEYLTGKRNIPLPTHRRKWNQYIELRGARENNLKNIDVRFPLHTLTVVTGVSGSGKSSLVRGILAPVLSRQIDGVGDKPGKYDELRGDVSQIKHIEFVDQNPIGRSSRSNPVTYLKAYDEIRKIFAQQQLSKQNNFKASHFSFNTDGGRCEECQGEGFIKVEMQFMADVILECEHCGGQRFKDEVLEVKYRNKSIFDVLEMTVNEALEFFAAGKGKLDAKVVEKMQPLADVGLGYIKLGQSSSTLSGGESQRVKLASFLSKEAGHDATLFIFDEPTTGLHFHDINKLLDAFQALIKKGHSLLIIEHNLEIIKSADWLIDLGKEGGDEGGYIIAEGTPEDIIKQKESYTALHLSPKLTN
jgi:excinuclease ABC subunit A